MGYERCFGYNCFESRHSFPTNPVPRFNFTSRKHHLLPVTSSTQASTTTTEAVKTIVENTFQTLIEEPTTAIASSEEKISEIFTSASVNTEGNTVQQIIDTVTQAISNQTAILNEDTTNNNSVLNITDIVNDNEILDSINSDSIPINPNIFSTPENEEIATTTLSDIVTTATEKTISTIHSTTEKVMDIFASTVPAERHHEKHDNAESSHTGIYVILGIIVGVLLLVCILLIFLYVRHRKNNSHSLVEHPYYNIHPKNETVPTTSDQEKEYQNDLYVQYKC